MAHNVVWAKATVLTIRMRSCYCRRVCATGCRRIIWPISSAMWWITLTFRRWTQFTAMRNGTAAVRPFDDDQGVGVWLLRGSVQFAQDRTATGRRHRLPGAGSGQPTELPHDLGFPQDSPEDAGGLVRAGVAYCTGGRGHEGGAG